MSEYLLIIFGALTAYLLGSIPTAVWLGRSWYGMDVRQFGSGNAGATNTFRVLGKKIGIIVLLFDCLKGWLAAFMAYIAMKQEIVPKEDLLYYQLFYGVLAIVGHIYPIYVGFRGGKGVATMLGVVISIHWEAALLSLGVFLVVFMAFHYVSLGSMIASLSFPLVQLIPALRPDNPLLIQMGFCLSGVLIWSHRRNIQRLYRGTESKLYFYRRATRGEDA